MNPLTPAELDALEVAIEGTVSPDHPWRQGDDSECDEGTSPHDAQSRVWHEDTLVMDLCDHDYGPEIATGVVAMHNALPSLIAMAREAIRLRDEIKALEDENESLEDSLTRELSDPRPRRPWTDAEIKEMGR